MSEMIKFILNLLLIFLVVTFIAVSLGMIYAYLEKSFFKKKRYYKNYRRTTPFLSEIGYLSKPIMTNAEYRFYLKLKKLPAKYIIHPQISLLSITKKTGIYKYASELNRIIDFAIFDQDYRKLLLLIELNDRSHQKIERKKRDLKVKKICNDIGVQLMTFYLEYPNEETYVINRILKVLKLPNEINEK